MKDMVDVCGGRMTLSEVIREIRHYMAKDPSHLVVEFNKTTDGHRVIIWMTEPDFKNKC